MYFDVDGLMVDFSDEILIKALIDTCNNQIKRAYLTAHGSYTEDDLKSTEFTQGLWQGLISAQTSTGGAQKVAESRKKRIAQIEANYKQ